MKDDTETRKKLIEELKKMPIVQIACSKVGIGRATYYRWKDKNKKFKKETDTAILKGCLFINDLAESQLIGTIKDKKIQGIALWLKHHHPAYSTKVEVIGHLKTSSEDPLTPEQQALVKKALKMAGLAGKSNKHKK